MPDWAYNGLSPRLRGNRVLEPSGNLPERSIPAPAGEPGCPGPPGPPADHRSIPAPAGEPMSWIIAWAAVLDRVYPRACGGTDYVLFREGRAMGLSPRLRGNPIQLSPYRAGLAEPALQCFQAVAALPTCCFPHWLSPQGRSVDPRTFSEFFPIEPGILCRVTRRTVHPFLDHRRPP